MKIKMGLALGGGAMRGLAHIGVLKALEEQGFRPDYIAGTSIGAVIGALYASGVTPYIMSGLANNLNARSFYDITPPRKGFIKGNNIEQLIALLTKGREFKELNIPLAVTATDLTECKLVVFTEGKVYKAVRASISVPGIFIPVEAGNMVLVDGGVLERVPTRIVREMGADIVISVDVGFQGQHKKPDKLTEVIFQAFEVMELEILKHKTVQSDIAIYPDVSNIDATSLEQAEECIQAGYKATIESMDRIKKLLSIL